MKFSEYYSLGLQQPELDFVDIDPDRDLELYIDPFAFSKGKDHWSTRCHNEIFSFFQSVVHSIKSGELRKAQLLLHNLSEPNETCLGLSSNRPKGRGVSGKQAQDLYAKLIDSEAVRTGFLSELAECELLIPGIGHDKVSDIATNIIRKLLIEYTQAQCHLHGIKLTGTVASGRLWDSVNQEWTQELVRLPVINGRKVILVPKVSVRWNMNLKHREYYNGFVLNYLQGEHLSRPGSSLVKTLKSGRMVVYKKDLKSEYPLDKDFLYRFSKAHPEVLRAYKQNKGDSGPLTNSDFELFDEKMLAEGIIARLRQIPPGSYHASDFHKLMIGALEFIFYPELIYPEKEREINEGRKRIDIVYTNAATSGFFYRIHTAPEIAAKLIMVECKNYRSDPQNPELDQLSGRYAPFRGRFGFLIARTFENRDLFLERCRDTVRDGRGIIVPLVDQDVEHLLQMIIRGRRKTIDSFLEGLYRTLLA